MHGRACAQLSAHCSDSPVLSLLPSGAQTSASPPSAPSAGPRPSRGSCCLWGLTTSEAQALSGSRKGFLRSVSGQLGPLDLYLPRLEPRPPGDQLTGRLPGRGLRTTHLGDAALLRGVVLGECLLRLSAAQGPELGEVRCGRKPGSW